MTLLNPFGKYEALAAGIALAIALSVAGLTGAHLQKLGDVHKYDQLVLSDAQAQSKAIEDAYALQKSIDTKILAAATADATAQTVIVSRSNKTITEVPYYVKDTIPVPGDCITFGFVRVLDSAALGVDPSSLLLPAGATDDTCTTLKASDLAKSIIDNYSTAEQNAKQLNDLIGLVQQK